LILTTLSITVSPGEREEMIKAFWLLLGPLRVEPGCLACDLYQNIGNEDGFFYLEAWQTSEQLERHMRSARYERLLAIMEASAQPPLLRYHLVSDTRGLEYLEAVRLGSAVPPPPPPDQPARE
jgi:quinol monooxygenase YgiN